MPTQPVTTQQKDTPLAQQVIAVLWPSFLTAVVATGVLYSLFNPTELALLVGYADFSPLGGYTLGFFFFWLIAAVASGLTVYFARPCNRKKHRNIDGN